MTEENKKSRRKKKAAEGKVKKIKPGNLKIIKEIKPELKPELKVGKPEMEGFLESFPRTHKRVAPVLESAQEPEPADLEDVLAEAAMPREEGKEEKRKEGKGPSYFASQPSYFTAGEESSSGTASEARGEATIGEIIDILRSKKALVASPSRISEREDVDIIDKSRTLGPVHLPEMKATVSEDYVIKYAKPRARDKTIEWVKKGGVDVKKYRRAK